MSDDLKVLGVDVEQVTEQEEDGPAVGTYSLLARLSDNTRAVPMGGQGFATKEDAEAAVGRVKLDGDSLTVQLPLYAFDAEVQVRGRNPEDARKNAEALAESMGDKGYVFLPEGEPEYVAEPQWLL